MRSPCGALLAAAWAILLAACQAVPGAAHPRPALALPAELAAYYQVPGELRVEALAAQPDIGALQHWHGQLAAGDERVHFQILRPAQRPDAPFVALVPILAGGENLMHMVAEALGRRGYAVGWCRRVAGALVAPQRCEDLERLFRRTVVHYRMLLAWAREAELVAGRRAAVLGISMGGIIGSVLMAVEPDLQAGALCLAGADLPELVLCTTENRVLRWLEWRRRQDGCGDWEIGTELRRHLRSDPVHLSACVPTGKVLLVAATLDEVVPWHHQQLLWEALGRPRRVLLPLGHYSAALMLHPILDAVARFFDETVA